MPTYFSPSGNAEIWDAGMQPADYLTPEAWLAAHPAPEPEPPTEEEIRQQRITEIKASLTALDAKAARPMRAILLDKENGVVPSGADLAELAVCEAEVLDLRTELAELAELTGLVETAEAAHA